MRWSSQWPTAVKVCRVSSPILTDASVDVNSVSVDARASPWQSSPIMKKTRINPKVFAKSNAYAAGQRTVRAVGIQQHNAQGLGRNQGRSSMPKVRRR